jgi:signal transduction histidine kinase
VLTNLVTNAWEAVGEELGTVSLTVKTVSQTDIPSLHRFPIDWQSQDLTYACLEVMDTDYGIAREDRDKLFDPFFSSKFTGRGLGLSVVLGIVNAHSGAIAVESELRRGTLIRVFLPVLAEKISLAD